ncbi:MAG TPA: YfhO family protein [Puia sp.]|nr:YfhO family protein [Puia sp.]
MNSSLLKKALPHIIAVVVFLVVSIVYCKPVLQGKALLQSDVIQYKGMARQSQEFKEKHGHYPLWTEGAFSGMPAYTIAMEPRSAINIGYLHYVFTLGLPKPINFFFLACVCFYFLAMVLGINPWIGILSALAYSFCSYNPELVATGHDTKIIAIGYAPAVIASLLLIYQRRYLWGGILLAIFFSEQLIITQHIQIVFYTILSMGLLTIAYLIYNVQQKKLKETFIGIAVAAVAGLLALGASALSTMPLNEYAKETMRGGRTELTRSTNKNESNDGLSKDYAFRWSYGIGETFTLAVPNSVGGGSGGKEIGEGSKFAEKAMEAFSMPEENALQLANGSAYWGDQPFTTGPVYAGAVVCFLFLLGIVYVKGWKKWWLVSAFILSVVLAWGRHFAGLNYFLFDHFPLYNKFQAPAMALVIAQLAMPLLGALGLQELLTGSLTAEQNWKKFKTVLYATGGLVVVLAGLYFTASYHSESDNLLKEKIVNGKLQQLSQGKQPDAGMQQQAMGIGNELMKALQADRQSLFGSDLLRTFILIALAAALTGLYLKKKLNQTVLFAGLIVLSGYDLLSVGTRYLTEEIYADPADIEANLAPSAADQRIQSDADKNFRVFNETSSPFNDGRTSYHHNSVGGYSPAKLGLYQDLIDSQLLKGNMQVYNMLNTRYFIQADPTNGQPQARLNPGAYGPCWLVKAIHYVKDGKEEMKALDSINVKDTVIIQQQFEAEIKAAPVPDSTASIKLAENLNDQLTYKYSAKSNQFAVFSEVYYARGWNAFIDGNKAPYYRVDYLLRGMPLPAGEHTVEFRFEPHTYMVGNSLTLWTSLLMYLGLIAAVALEVRKRNKGTVAKS